VRLSTRLRVLERRVLVLNDRAFRAEQVQRLGLDLRGRLAWAKERRVAQLLRIDAGGRTFALANLHATSSDDKRIPDLELRRAADAAVALARDGEPVLLAGDFNVRGDASPVLAELTGPGGFSRALPGIDQVLVRGAASSEPVRWAEERRAFAGRLLSDHSPVEVDLELG
jgi:endonuclease/exonuclease/phosphatase family metal-dependent hydrolase